MNTGGKNYKMYMIEIFYKGQFLLILCLREKISWKFTSIKSINVILESYVFIIAVTYYNYATLALRKDK